jgi:hypothetical protein
MKLEYNSTVNKTLLYPVRGLHKQNRQDILVSRPLCPKIEVYVENVFFSLRRAATLKKEIFNKSTPIKILITRQGNKQAAQRHKIRSAVFYLRDQFPFYKDRFNESLSLES